MIFTLTLNPAVDREVVVPAFEFDAVLRAVSSRVDVGGKGFNVSRMLRNLGAPSVAVAFAGGQAGKHLESGLHALGIPSDFVWLEEETRTNVSIVADGRYIKVNEAGPRVSEDKKAELLRKVAGLAKPGDWWALAGSLPPGLEPSIYAEILKILNERGAQAIVDTSGAALRLACAERPFLVKPNSEEAQQLTGMPVDTLGNLAQAAGQVRQMGPQNVVISRGKDGAYLQTPSGMWMASAPAITQKNPIGAGDSLVGGMICALSRGESVPEALQLGMACGAATASLSGTELGSHEMVESLKPRIILSQI